MASINNKKKILHFGKNVANNPYNNVKALLTADQSHYAYHVLSFDNPHGMAQPEWEEASKSTEAKSFHNDWQKNSNPGTRPEWFVEKHTYRHSPRNGKKRVFPLRFYIENAKDHLLIIMVGLGITRSAEYLQLPKSAKAWLTVIILIGPCVFFYLLCKLLVRLEAKMARQFYLPQEIRNKIKVLETEHGIPRKLIDRYLPALCRIRFWTTGYDLIQVYSTDAVYSYLSGCERYVVYDNGPLREFGIGDKPVDKLLRLSYAHADHVFLTNPDVLETAIDIGIENYSHVPHYVDTDRYTNGQNTFRSTLDDTINFLVFAPARQNWKVKGNDILIRGFARFLTHNSNALLVIADWGQHTDNSRDLVKQLNIDNSVLFYQPIVKSKFVDYLRASDVVIDQCIIPTIGGIGPEAMATETALITSFSSDLNRWCFADSPPLFPVFTDREVEVALTKIYQMDNSEKQQLGQKSRDWVLGNCGLNQLIKGHLACYAKLLL